MCKYFRRLNNFHRAKSSSLDYDKSQVKYWFNLSKLIHFNIELHDEIPSQRRKISTCLGDGWKRFTEEKPWKSYAKPQIPQAAKNFSSHSVLSFRRNNPIHLNERRQL